MSAFDPQAFQRKLAAALGPAGFDVAAFQAKLANELGTGRVGFDAATFERKLADTLSVNAPQWQATIARDPATRRTTSMLMTPAGSGTPILITPAFDSEGLMTAATIAPLESIAP